MKSSERKPKRTLKVPPTSEQLGDDVPGVEMLMPLPPETLGNQLRRAYKLGQQRRPELTYRKAAEMIKPFQSISDASLIRWEKDLTDIASTPRSTLMKVWYALLVYGTDPASVGLSIDAIGINPLLAKTAIELLVPSSACFSEAAA